MKYDKNSQNVRRYNLRNLPGRKYYSNSLATSKVTKPKVSKKVMDNKFGWNNFNVFETSEGLENDWVSATSIKNYLLKDPLIDWLDLQYKNNKSGSGVHQIQNNNMENILFEMGNKFESEVINTLRTKYPNSIKRVIGSRISPELNDLTFQYMNEGTPIIEQAVLYNLENKTYGVADILIRSDWINRIFSIAAIPESEETRKAEKLSGNYHYRVIDIKWTTMYLCSNGKTIRNSYRFPAYKGQLAIYNAALGIMQGYTPNEAFILAKSWNLNDGKQEGHDCFTKLGCIDFGDFDNKYIEETHDAIKWIRNVRQNGPQWTCNPPEVEELYPNMCNKYDAPYHSIKQNLADKLKEITQIYNVGIKNRQIAHKKKIYSWDDSRCNSKNLGIKGIKIGPIVDKIIKINRDSKKLIKPAIVKNNMQNWQTENDLDFYIDFEGISSSLYKQDIILENGKTADSFLFLIGVGYKRNDMWNYKVFLMKNISKIEERKTIEEFTEFIEMETKKYMNANNLIIRCTPRFFHWSNAEKSMFSAASKRHGNAFNLWAQSVEWIDMCKVFTDEPIVVKGAKRFALKEVARNMASHGMIQSNWSTHGPDNGLEAMTSAIKYYHYMDNPAKNLNEYDAFALKMVSIINYNEVDCKVIWEIVSYLRAHHRK
jgi:hypothetical protein